MPELSVRIGGREYEVACRPGEERHLEMAVAMLDAEATALADRIGELPEARMLLMAGLMLADRAVGMEKKLRDRKSLLAGQSNGANETSDQESGEADDQETSDRLAELAAQAEALAERIEGGKGRD